jgi:hypothetical protein
MDYYDFFVTEFTIHDTRSLHEDTLHLAYSVSVDSDVVAASLLKLGDFNNGTYHTEQYVHGGASSGLRGVVINAPFAKVGFAFQLLNAGNVSDATLSGRVASTADQLAGITAGLSGAAASGVLGAMGSPAFPIGLAIEAFANLWSWLTANCDGPVAVDQLSGPRYLLDAWLDNKPLGELTFNRNYPGTDSADGCGGNSNYDVSWYVQHYRGWGEVWNQTDGPLLSQTSVSAAAHNGAFHVFGTLQDGTVSHARTFTGATWSIDKVGKFDLNASHAISAISFNDRLWLFGVKSNGSVASLAYTEDGGSWTQEETTIPAMNFTAAQPVATVAYRNRLHVFARDQTSQLHRTSSSDLALWDPWAVVPPTGLAPTSPVTAVSFGDALHLFGICLTNKPPGTFAVVHNSTADGITWTGWAEIENGAHPLGQPTAQPENVAATVFRERVYLATRWKTTDAGTQNFTMFVNFSGDASNWSGWRSPESTVDFQPAATAAVAPLNHHLYIAAPKIDSTGGGNTQVWAY